VILVDTSVWVDHFRRANPVLAGLLDNDDVLTHPLIIGELAVGNLNPRTAVLHALQHLPQAHCAYDQEVLRLIEQDRLFGLGIGYIDAHLLASVRLTPGTSLWTHDKRLAGIAERFSLTARLN
jgi:predicted nucleic acid-binding protein